MYVWGEAATFHGGHDAPGAKGALNATETAGQEPPSAWGEVGMAVSYKDGPLSSFHARLSTCCFYFHIVNLLFVWAF